MKLRFTTPASVFTKKRLSRVLISVVAVLMATASSLQFFHTASADQYDDQIASLQKEIDSYNSQSAQLASQAQTYATAVASLQTQEATLQTQIDLSQAKYNQLVAQIADTQQKIDTNQKALGETLADLYIDGQTTPLEMLASSKSISDYLDKQTQQASIKDQLGTTIKTIQALKTQLTNEKADVQRTLADEQSSQGALQEKQQEQQTLLAQTQGQEAAYQQLVTTDKAKQAQLAAQQEAAMAAAFKSTGGATMIKSGAAASGGYPWNNSNCPMDGWLSTGGSNGNGGDGYGYGCRQCASYAAWRVDKETGYYPLNWGSAINFPASAARAGFDEGSTPRPGSLAVMSVATSGNANGHIAWVEAVNDDGTIIVSQYNANYNGIGWGNYSEMKMSASLFFKYIYIMG